MIIFVLYISYYTYDEMEMHCDLLNVNTKISKKNIRVNVKWRDIYTIWSCIKELSMEKEINL